MLAAALLGAAGCSSSPPPQATGPVTVPVPSATVATPVAATCGALLAALPDEIDPGVRRRPVEGNPTRVAAWGDPAVVLECGAPAPDRVEQPAIVNGVTWSVRDIGAGFRWTTSGLGVHVSVDIPDAYDNGAELVIPLAAPILRILPG